ncbi:MAG: diguanylate cyclase [Gemmatimonadales bacterium]
MPLTTGLTRRTPAAVSLDAAVSSAFAGSRPGFRVLLVEDNPVDAMRIRQLLARCRSAQFTVDSTASLGAALERAAAGNLDLVLLDLNLPDSLGVDTFMAFNCALPGLPIIVLANGRDEALGLEAVQQGAQDVLLKSHLSADGLARTIRCAVERHRVVASLRGLSLTDELTGLLNRRGFTTIAQGQLRLASRTGNRFLLFYCDLDDLKTINDTHGHHEGDTALMRVAEVLRRSFRQSDVVARLGGDEFVMLALDTSSDEGETIRRRLAANLEEENTRLGVPYRLSMSLGVLSFDARLDEPLGALLARADQVLYQAKRSRPGRSVRPSPAPAGAR